MQVSLSLWVRVPLVRFCACAITRVLCLQIFHLGIMGNFQNSRKNSVQGIVLRTINLNLHDYFPPLIRQSIYIYSLDFPCVAKHQGSSALPLSLQSRNRIFQGIQTSKATLRCRRRSNCSLFRAMSDLDAKGSEFTMAMAGAIASFRPFGVGYPAFSV